MNRKKDLRELTMTREEISALLRGQARLSGEEEKVLRMRYGCSLDAQAPLARDGEGDADLQAELLLMEHDVVKAAQKIRGALGAAHRPQASREKAAIIQALRKRR